MTVLILITITIGTLITRFAPFILFRNVKIEGKYATLLNSIPYATISLLLVYAFKDVNRSNVFATVVASAACVFLYSWKKNTIVSIVIPTAIYMILIQRM